MLADGNRCQQLHAAAPGKGAGGAQPGAMAASSPPPAQYSAAHLLEIVVSTWLPSLGCPLSEHSSSSTAAAQQQNVHDQMWLHLLNVGCLHCGDPSAHAGLAGCGIHGFDCGRRRAGTAAVRRSHAEGVLLQQHALQGAACSQSRPQALLPPAVSAQAQPGEPRPMLNQGSPCKPCHPSTLRTPKYSRTHLG